MNLFESFDEIVSGDFYKQIELNTEDQLGDFPAALNGIFYTLVAGLIRRSNSDMSSSMLFNQIQEKYQKVSQIGELSEQIEKKEGFQKIAAEGGRIISQIFPAFKSPLVSMISSYANTSKNSTVLFSGLTASILISLLGKKIKSDKFDKDDLVNFLKQHHEPLFAKAPASLMEKMIPALGLQELSLMKYAPSKKTESSSKNTENKAVEETKYTDHSHDSDGESAVSKKVVIIGLIVVFLGVVGYLLYSKGIVNFDTLFSKSETPAETVDEDAVGEDSLAFQSSVDTSLLATDTTAKAAVVATPPAAGAGLKEYLQDPAAPAGKEFELKSVKFAPNSSTLNESTNPEVSELSGLMQANSGIDIKIIGYEENGDAKIALRRAFAIKRILLANGIKNIRMDAVSGGAGKFSPKVVVLRK
ncbi:OmpA family protein [Emticicia sp. CRIBPO]|uniref:OmpA family protein n=1 Tax=Emticicia sp. CRIBPO TaxID=2683258 RepID=UPI001411CD7D|nr:OmpA family protein [Emticicia sp. CRIBPO]NBA86170.1 OmpA family protein [Emticicia sp. CRIBPO]